MKSVLRITIIFVASSFECVSGDPKCWAGQFSEMACCYPLQEYGNDACWVPPWSFELCCNHLLNNGTLVEVADSDAYISVGGVDAGVHRLKNAASLSDSGKDTYGSCWDAKKTSWECCFPLSQRRVSAGCLRGPTTTSSPSEILNSYNSSGIGFDKIKYLYTNDIINSFDDCCSSIVLTAPDPLNAVSDPVPENLLDACWGLSDAGLTREKCCYPLPIGQPHCFDEYLTPSVCCRDLIKGAILEEEQNEITSSFVRDMHCFRQYNTSLMHEFSGVLHPLPFHPDSVHFGEPELCVRAGYQFRWVYMEVRAPDGSNGKVAVTSGVCLPWVCSRKAASVLVQDFVRDLLTQSPGHILNIVAKSFESTTIHSRRYVPVQLAFKRFVSDSYVFTFLCILCCPVAVASCFHAFGFANGIAFQSHVRLFFQRPEQKNSREHYSSGVDFFRVVGTVLVLFHHLRFQRYNENSISCFMRPYTGYLGNVIIFCVSSHLLFSRIFRGSLSVSCLCRKWFRQAPVLSAHSVTMQYIWRYFRSTTNTFLFTSSLGLAGGHGMDAFKNSAWPDKCKSFSIFTPPKAIEVASQFAALPHALIPWFPAGNYCVHGPKGWPWTTEWQCFLLLFLNGLLFRYINNFSIMKKIKKSCFITSNSHKYISNITQETPLVGQLLIVGIGIIIVNLYWIHHCGPAGLVPQHIGAYIFPLFNNQNNLGFMILCYLWMFVANIFFDHASSHPSGSFLFKMAKSKSTFRFYQIGFFCSCFIPMSIGSDRLHAWKTLFHESVPWSSFRLFVFFSKNCWLACFSLTICACIRCSFDTRGAKQNRCHARNAIEFIFSRAALVSYSILATHSFVVDYFNLIDLLSSGSSSSSEFLYILNFMFVSFGVGFVFWSLVQQPWYVLLNWCYTITCAKITAMYLHGFRHCRTCFVCDIKHKRN